MSNFGVITSSDDATIIGSYGVVGSLTDDNLGEVKYSYVYGVTTELVSELQLNLGDDTGTLQDMGYPGPYQGVVPFPYPAPFGVVDPESSFNNVSTDSNSTWRVVTAFQHATIDHVAAQLETPPYGNSVYDHIIPESNYTGTDFETRQIKYSDGSVSPIYTVSITLQNARPQGTWTIGPITKDHNTASLQPVYNSTDASTFKYTLDGLSWIPFTTSINLTNLDPETTYTSAAVRAFNSAGSGARAPFVFTTDAEPNLFPPTLSNPLDDVVVVEGDYLNIALASYFSGATSYIVTGFPVGSGLSYSSTVISGTANLTDVNSSPLALTITATNSDGSIAESFNINVTDGVSTPSGNWSIGSIITGVDTVGLTPFYNGSDATYFEYTIDGVNWLPFTGTIFEDGLDKNTYYLDAAVRAVNLVGPGPSASFQFKTQNNVETVTKKDNRVRRIIANARLTLADPNKERWDDDTLAAIVNEAQVDFCQQTQLLHERINVPIFANHAYFDLPDNCWQLTRVLYDNDIIPLVTHHELDDNNSTSLLSKTGLTVHNKDWELHEGTPAAIVYDRTNMLEGKVYPIPDERFRSDRDVGYLGVATSGEGVEFSDIFGVITDVEDTSKATIDYSSILGVISNLKDESITSYLKCYFLKNPATVENIDSTLDIPGMYDIALKFYVCGQAFMNDIDTGYQQKGADQMRIYERHVKTAKRDSARDFTRAGQFETEYRLGV